MASHHSRKPNLVLLHGFLGRANDWQAHIQKLRQHFNCIALDLPFHGQQSQTHCNNITSYANQIKAQLIKLNIKQFHLLGYSLGGRVAMDLSVHNQLNTEFDLLSLIIESSHFGLATQAEQEQRWQSDQQWAIRFEQQDLSQSLAQWYQQSVFESLSEIQVASLIQLRKHQNRAILAQALIAASIAKQQDYRASLAKLDIPMMLVNGELDVKYQALYQQQHSSFKHCHWNPIPKAGHNTHLEQPQQFCDAVINFIG